MTKLTHHIKTNLYSLYWIPKSLCYQVEHEQSGAIFNYDTEELAIQSVIDVGGTFVAEVMVMHA